LSDSWIIRSPWNRHGLAAAIALFAVVVATSLFYDPIVLACVVAIPCSVYFISRPFELLLLMVFLIPFNFVFTIGEIPVAIELLKIVAWVPFLVNRRDTLRTSRYNKYFIVLAGLLVLSVIRSPTLGFTVKEVVRFGSNLGLCYLVLNLVDTREKLFQVLRVLAVSTFLVACYGFYQLLIHDFGALFWLVNPRVTTSFAPQRYTFYQWRERMISVLTSEMELGHYFNLCLPIGAALWLTEGRRQLSSKWLWISVTFLVGLLLTYTFAAWLALAMTTTLFVVLLDKDRRWKLLLSEATTVVLVALAAVYGPLRPMVESKVFGSSMASLGFDLFTRFRMWFFAFETWLSHPVLGVGLGNYQNISGVVNFEQTADLSGSSPHQIYLYLLVNFGIVGTACVLIVLLGSIRAGFRLRADAHLGVIALALAFALTTNMIGGFGDDSTMFSAHAGYLVWLLIALSECIRNLAFRNETPLAHAVPRPT